MQSDGNGGDQRWIRLMRMQQGRLVDRSRVHFVHLPRVDLVGR